MILNNEFSVNFGTFEENMIQIMSGSVLCFNFSLMFNVTAESLQIHINIQYHLSKHQH